MMPDVTNLRCRPLLVPLALSLVFAVALWRVPEQAVAPFAAPAATQAGAADLPPYFQARFASSTFNHHVHSSSIAPLPDGGLIAAWFAGSREGARDVNIHAARFDPQRGRWGEHFNLVSRQNTEVVLQRDIRKLGNPVIALAPNDRLWLFYVSVSLGGWAGSAINSIHSDDGGATWTKPRRLITSPFLNISTLVRNPPVFHADGSMGLPVYHEFLGKFAEYLYLDADGNVVDKFRISAGTESLQPSVVPQGDDRALALLRNAGEEHGRVLASFTRDRGQTWSEYVPVAPANPNSAVAAISDGEGGVLVALNDLENGRFRLTLYRADGELRHWQRVTALDEGPLPQEWVDAELFRTGLIGQYRQVASVEQETPEKLLDLVGHARKRACRSLGCTFKYEYPTLIKGADGYFHMVYSWNNTLIKHVAFNNSWVAKQR